MVGLVVLGSSDLGFFFFLGDFSMCLCLFWVWMLC